ncbi:F-box domain cyclin-like protein [Teratosphaeria destructans]|uniref:F-box domain cyclin-like protein n=1 Tax=Teratosphaeria destructans TaxID=418781 RepID=A0A9W7SQT2_9PEZI|nr:F-box domain cyclin-like protein [Teratosphaeria destructans]
MEDLLERFRALPSPEHRSLTLKQIISSLTRPELHLVVEAIAQRFDPLAILPIELVRHIWSHLPLSAAWTLQLVCRRWRRVLGSEQTLKASIARWDTIHHPSDSAVPDPASHPLETRVRHLQAVRLGRPSQVAFYPDVGVELPKTTQRACGLKTVALKREFMAYVSKDEAGRPGVVLRNLITGRVRHFNGAARERMLGIALTSKLLAFVSFGAALYVQPLEQLDADAQCLRLPSSNLSALAADGETVAILYATEGSSSFTVVIHDGRSGRLRQLSHARQSVGGDSGASLLTARNLIVDESRDLIHVFSCGAERVGNTFKGLHVGHLTISGRDLQDGLPQQETASVHSLVPFRTGLPGMAWALDILPTGVKDRFHVRPIVVSDGGTLSSPFEDLRGEYVFFDASRAGFCKQLLWSRNDHAEPENDGPLPTLLESPILVWKDVIYCRTDHHFSLAIRTLSATIGYDPSSHAVLDLTDARQ